MENTAVKPAVLPVVEDSPSTALSSPSAPASTSSSSQADDQHQQQHSTTFLLTVLVMVLGALYLFLSARYRTKRKREHRPPPSAAATAQEEAAATAAAVDRTRLASLRAAKLEGQNAGRDGKKDDSTSSHNDERVFLPDHRLLVLLSSSSASDQHLAPPTTVLPTPSAPSVSPSCFAEVQPLDTVDELRAWAPNPAYLPPSSYTVPLSHPPSSSSSSSSSPSFISGQGRRVGGEGGREGGRDRSRLLVCHDLQGGYLADRHCFGLSCPWGEGGREEGGRDGAEAGPAVEAAGAGGGGNMEKGEGEEGRGKGLGVEEKKEGEREGAAKDTEEAAALATVPPPSLAPALAPAFRLQALDLCDTFIYFSHHLISFPPSSWVSLCHRQGVRCLGTFITEWESGKEACRRLFASPSLASSLARQMVEMARHHGMDGWLINIENEVEVGGEGGVENVLVFLEALTAGMKEGGEEGVVLWYDSVVSDTGKLEWQDGLTRRNERFFHACDGMFTNYCWKEEGPALSAALADAPLFPLSLPPASFPCSSSSGLAGAVTEAPSVVLPEVGVREEGGEGAKEKEEGSSGQEQEEGSLLRAAAAAARAGAATTGAASKTTLTTRKEDGRSRRWDVWMGVDCFGRGTFGGGGFDCDLALKVVRRAGVSAALFAPGWVWEEEVRRREREREEVGVGAVMEGNEEGEGRQDHAQSTVALSPPPPPPSSSSHDRTFLRVEQTFQRVQEKFWSKIGRVFPRRPFPAGSLISASCAHLAAVNSMVAEAGRDGGQEGGHGGGGEQRVLLTNFGSGVGRKVWVAGGKVALRPAFTALATMKEGGKEGGRGGPLAWFNMYMQDPLPLALTDCSVATGPAPSLPPSLLASAGGGHRLGSAHDDDDNAGTGVPSLAPSLLRAHFSYQTAYHGGSSLCVSGGILHPEVSSSRSSSSKEGGVSFPLITMEVPTSMLTLEVSVVYKCVLEEEDEFALELILVGGREGAMEEGKEQGQGAMRRLEEEMAKARARRRKTRIVLRGEVRGAGAGGEGAGKEGGWASRRVGKVVEERGGGREGSSSRKMFFAPVADYLAVEEGEDGKQEGVAAALSSAPKTALRGSAAASITTPITSTSFSFPPLLPTLDEEAEDEKEEQALAAIPWRRRLFRLRDLQLEGDTIQDLRLVCLKRPLPSSSLPPSPPHPPRPYCLYLGEFTLGHVRAPARKEEQLPSLRRSLALPPLQRPTNLLRLNRLAFGGGSEGGKEGAWVEEGSVGLRGAGWEEGTRTLSGQLVWTWRRPQDVHSTEVFLFFLPPALHLTVCPSPLWLGRAWTSVFPLCLALPPWEGRGEGGRVRLVLQPRDGLGNVLPLCECPSLEVAVP